MTPNPVLGWIECHPALGSYFTIGAIVAALWVGSAAIRADKRRDAARRRVTAFRLAPTIVAVLGDAERARTAAAHVSANFTSSLQMMQAAISRIAPRARIPADVFAETWTLPPAIALAVAQLATLLERQASAVDALGITLVAMQPVEQAQTLAVFRANLDAITRLAAEINQYCGAVSDRVVLARRRARTLSLRAAITHALGRFHRISRRSGTELTDMVSSRDRRGGNDS